MKKKIKISKNYLKKIPVRSHKTDWKTDESGRVTLRIQNKGWANKLAQMLLGKPKISYIHLDEIGSFLWPKLNGELNVIELANLVKEQFGQKAEPLYERLAQYIRILESYNFIEFKE